MPIKQPQHYKELKLGIKNGKFNRSEDCGRWNSGGAEMPLRKSQEKLFAIIQAWGESRLDQSHKPIPEFIDEINGLGANFPTKAFLAGMGAMQWNNMIEEFDEIETIKSNQVVSQFSIKQGIMGTIRMRMSDVIKGMNSNGKTFKP